MKLSIMFLNNCFIIDKDLLIIYFANNFFFFYKVLKRDQYYFFLDMLWLWFLFSLGEVALNINFMIKQKREKKNCKKKQIDSSQKCEDKWSIFTGALLLIFSFLIAPENFCFKIFQTHKE